MDWPVCLHRCLVVYSMLYVTCLHYSGAGGWWDMTRHVQ